MLEINKLSFDLAGSLKDNSSMNQITSNEPKLSKEEVLVEHLLETELCAYGREDVLPSSNLLRNVFYVGRKNFPKNSRKINTTPLVYKNMSITYFRSLLHGGGLKTQENVAFEDSDMNFSCVSHSCEDRFAYCLDNNNSFLCVNKKYNLEYGCKPFIVLNSLNIDTAISALCGDIKDEFLRIDVVRIPTQNCGRKTSTTLLPVYGLSNYFIVFFNTIDEKLLSSIYISILKNTLLSRVKGLCFHISYLDTSTMQLNTFNLPFYDDVFYLLEYSASLNRHTSDTLFAGVLWDAMNNHSVFHRLLQTDVSAALSDVSCLGLKLFEHCIYSFDKVKDLYLF